MTATQRLDRTRHGFGYSVFEHDAAGIHSEMTVFVAIDAAVKFSLLVLRNDSDRPRRLSVTGYVEWVLGDLRAKTVPHIGSTVSLDNGALYARNPFSNDFGDWVGFFDADERAQALGSFTCDRTEFIGRNGSLRRPDALRRARLSGRSGAGLDPCAAIQVPLDTGRRGVARDRLSPRHGSQHRRGGLSWCSASAATSPRARPWRRCTRTGRTRSARCR